MSLIRSERRSVWPLEPFWPESRIDRMFRDMVRNLFSGESLLDRGVDLQPHLMRVEEYVEDDTAVVRAELPGIDPDKDVELTVADGVLHLHAAREERSEEKRPEVYRSEFRYGRLERSIRLPEGVTAADVKATYKDGILEIRVPVPKEPASPKKKIAIEHS